MPSEAPRDRESVRNALLAAMDQFHEMAEWLEGAVTHLKSNGWTDDQARAIVASNFGWKPAPEEPS